LPSTGQEQEAPHLVDPPDPKEPTEVLRNQAIPPQIPLTNIKFYWAAGVANWREPTNRVITEFRGIEAEHEAVVREWPSSPPLNPRQWAINEIRHMKETDLIAPRISRRALARALKPRLDDAHNRKLVKHTMTEASLYNALGSRQWKLWPVSWRD
jgi:hypothetical protein